jgi:hypothetical protein
MLMTERWERKSAAAARAQDSGNRSRPIRTAARRLGAEWWRTIAQEFIEISEAGVASAAVVALLAGATLLLIRSIAA